MKINEMTTNALQTIALGAAAYGAAHIVEKLYTYGASPETMARLQNYPLTSKVIAVALTAFCTLASIYGSYQRANYNTEGKTNDENRSFEAGIRVAQGAMVIGLSFLSLLTAGLVAEYRNPTPW